MKEPNVIQDRAGERVTKRNRIGDCYDCAPRGYNYTGKL